MKLIGKIWLAATLSAIAVFAVIMGAAMLTDAAYAHTVFTQGHHAISYGWQHIFWSVFTAWAWIVAILVSGGAAVTAWFWVGKEWK